MRRDFLIAAFVASLAVLLPCFGTAQQSGEGEARRRAQAMQGRLKAADRATRWWNRDRVAEQVGVTDQQKAQLDAAADEAQEQRRAASREFARIYSQLVIALSGPEIDQLVVEIHRQEIEAASASIMATSVDQLLAVREILTPEQWTTLR